MALHLLRFLCWSLARAASLVSFTLIRGAALAVVTLIQALKLSRTAADWGAARAACLADAGARRLEEAVRGLATSNITGVGRGAAAGALGLAAAAGEGVMQRVKEVAWRACESFPEAFETVREAAGEVVADAWEHYKDAVNFVRDYIR